MRFAEVSEFADTQNLNFRPWLSIHDPRASTPGTLVHPVLDGQRFIGRLLAEHPVREFFRPGSALREGLLSQLPEEDIVEPLRRALVRERDHPGVGMLYEEAAAQGWPTPSQPDDLAFCKPALSSSVSRWSQYPDAARDACGANGETLPVERGFHTSEEREPWWQVDLLRPHEIEEVAIVNSRNNPQRFRQYRIESSLDASTWIIRHEQAEPEEVSWDAEWPRRLVFAPTFIARYVRIVVIGVGILHLRRVQVFGPSAVAEEVGSSRQPDEPIR
jgi:hypothetical protein